MLTFATWLKYLPELSIIVNSMALFPILRAHSLPQRGPMWDSVTLENFYQNHSQIVKALSPIAPVSYPLSCAPGVPQTHQVHRFPTTHQLTSKY